MEEVKIDTASGVYAGSLEGGFAQGPGVFEEPRGRSYEGTWLEGKPVGSGCIRRPALFRKLDSPSRDWDGNLASEGRWVAYTGRIEEGVAWGLGALQFESGASLEGPFDRGLPEGFCRLSWPNGDSVEGPYSRGTPDGVFSCTDVSESSIEKRLFVLGADCTPPAMKPKLFIPTNVQVQQVAQRPPQDLSFNKALVESLLREINLEQASLSEPSDSEETEPGARNKKRTSVHKPAAVARKFKQLSEGKKLSPIDTRSSRKKKTAKSGTFK